MPALPVHRLVALLLVLAAPMPASANAPMGFTLEAISAESYSTPHDIVLSPDHSRLYVADNNAHRIAVLDPTSLTELGVFAEGEVRSPHDVVFDAGGRLLVADTGNSRIAIYEVSGNGGRLVGELSGSLRRPEGVDVHPDGRVFATGAASGNLVVWRGGEQVAETGGFSSPHDVVVMPDGRIWVADANNDRLVVLDDSLAVVNVIEGAPWNFNGVRYLDFDDAGRIHAADKYTNSIKILAADGSLLQVLGGPERGKGEGVFNQPEGVEILGDTAWYADSYNNRILRYRMHPAE